MAPTEPILVDDGRRQQVIDHNIQITVAVQVSHVHTATTSRRVETPIGPWLKMTRAIVLEDQIFFDQFVIRQMTKHFFCCHAVHHIEIQKTILVQIPKLGRPAPSRRLYTSRNRLIFKSPIAGRNLKDVLDDLLVMGDVDVFHRLH